MTRAETDATAPNPTNGYSPPPPPSTPDRRPPTADEGLA